jgi:hypothetical protein
MAYANTTEYKNAMLAKIESQLLALDTTLSSMTPEQAIFYAALTAKHTDVVNSFNDMDNSDAYVALPANNIDMDAGTLFSKTITATTTLTVSNMPTTGKVGSFILELTNGGAYTASFNFGSSIKWQGGTAPTLTASGTDLLGFYTRDGGTTWRGFVLSRDSK